MNSIARHMLELDAERTLDFRTLPLYDLAMSWAQGPSVLDAGCGPGYLTVALARMGFEVTACDLAAQLVDKCKAKAQAAGVSVHAEQLDILSLAELWPGRFDTIFCIDALEFVKDDVGAFRAIATCLRPGGRAVISVSALRWLFSERDRHLGMVRRYHKPDLMCAMAEAGLDVIDVRYWNAIGVLPLMVAARVLRRPLQDTLRKRGGRLWRVINVGLRRALELENHIPFPLGVTLFAVAERSELTTG